MKYEDQLNQVLDEIAKTPGPCTSSGHLSEITGLSMDICLAFLKSSPRVTRINRTMFGVNVTFSDQKMDGPPGIPMPHGNPPVLTYKVIHYKQYSSYSYGWNIVAATSPEEAMELSNKNLCGPNSDYCEATNVEEIPSLVAKCQAGTVITGGGYCE